MEPNQRNDQMRRFLRFLLIDKSIRAGVKKSGVPNTNVHKWRKKYPLFEKAIQEVLNGTRQGKDAIPKQEIYDNSLPDLDSHIAQRMKKFLDALGRDTCQTVAMAADIAGESPSTIHNWRKDNPDFDEAMLQTIEAKTINLQDHVAKLEREAREKSLVPLSSDDHNLTPTEIAKMNAFIDALPRNKWNVSATCREVGIKTSTVVKWESLYPEFVFAMECSRVEIADIGEGAVIKVVEDPEASNKDILEGAKILLRNTAGRKRGYDAPHNKKPEDQSKYSKEQFEAAGKLGFILGQQNPSATLIGVHDHGATGK